MSALRHSVSFGGVSTKPKDPSPVPVEPDTSGSSAEFFSPAVSRKRDNPPLSCKGPSESPDESPESKEDRRDLQRCTTRTRRPLYGQRPLSLDDKKYYHELLRDYERSMEEIQRALRHFESNENFREFCR
ncbi:hypothetical protein BX616_004475, partial [Lobosporangium transversale]